MVQDRVLGCSVNFNPNSLVHRVHFNATADDDYADFTCEVRHEALHRDSPLRSTVQLSVQCKYIIIIIIVVRIIFIITIIITFIIIIFIMIIIIILYTMRSVGP